MYPVHHFCGRKKCNIFLWILQFKGVPGTGYPLPPSPLQTDSVKKFSTPSFIAFECVVVLLPSVIVLLSFCGGGGFGGVSCSFVNNLVGQSA